MLVYGDHRFSAKLHDLRVQLLRLAQTAAACPRDLDRVRALLIACGQVEQGVHDALPEADAAEVVNQFHRATAQAAAAFYSLAWSQPVALPPPTVESAAALAHLCAVLDSLAAALDVDVTVNVPEGFSIYALYPEQYLLAAGMWLAGHADRRAAGAVVVGVRSIGTTLAAVVATVLRAAEWQVQSLTVRPTGHPFARTVDLAGQRFAADRYGLIVDEGPGLSGSSLAATAAALVRAGMRRERLAFLPGHPNDPGSSGTDEVRVWWQSTSRYVAQADRVTFGGSDLHTALAATLQEPVVRVEEFGWGQWRHALYADSAAWPAVCTAFERVKFRYTLYSGRQVLVKFLGLAGRTPDLTSAADAAAAVLEQRAGIGLAPRVLGAGDGYVATEWVPGRSLDRDDLSPMQVDAAGTYLAQVAGAPLAQEENRAAVARLVEMMAVNTREAFGDEAVARLPELVVEEGVRSYGDGRMQPHEWVVGEDGRIVKVDGVGHDSDHTLVGVQSVTWDLAGLIVEWQLDDAAAARALAAYGQAGGMAVNMEALHFYRTAYLAFRLGQCTLAAQVHDPSEHVRLWTAAATYRNQLGSLLGIS